MVDDEAIEAAAGIIRAGGLVAFPTETVYGLGADAASDTAIARLYRVKGRPADHPSIVHLADPSTVDEGWVAAWPPAARRLAEAFWPGPLTVVAEAGPRAARGVLGDGSAIAIRIPDDPVALALITASGTGLAAPSANRFGRVSPTTAAHVRRDLGDDVDFVLDGGPCRVGVESTIVDCRSEPVRLVRPGGIALERLAAVLGGTISTERDPTLRAPGVLASHYAPSARVVVVDAPPTPASLARAGRRVALLAPTAVLAKPGLTDAAAIVLDAGPDDDQYATRLYALLREADAAGADAIVAVAPGPDGIGRAVRDRLRRAAALPDADERT